MTNSKFPDTSDASPLTSDSIKQHYHRPPSFTDLLPWMEYLPESKTFLLEDGVSLGALFEVLPVGCEARTPAFMTQLRDAIQIAIGAIPKLFVSELRHAVLDFSPGVTQLRKGLGSDRSRNIVCRAAHRSFRIRSYKFGLWTHGGVRG